MERRIYNKLVRDRIPEIKEREGERPETRVLDEAEFRKFVRLKLVEEAGEVNAAKTREDVVKELADLWEVIEAVMRTEAVTAVEVAALKEKRRTERGGFEKRIYLIASEEPLP